MKKLCNKCFKTKDVKEFYKQTNTPDGYKYMCISCAKEYSKKSHPKNKCKDEDLIINIAKLKFPKDEPIDKFQISFLLARGFKLENLINKTKNEALSLCEQTLAKILIKEEKLTFNSEPKYHRE